MALSLPQIGTREDQFLDFKERLCRAKGGKTDYLELAKDMAAMANAYGGTLVVGAKEQPSGTLLEYTPLTEADAAEVCDGYAIALRDRIGPSIVALPETIRQGAGFVVTITVQQARGQAIGVRFKAREELDPNETKAPLEIFGFPVRVGDNTTWLQPEQLPMLMMPELRRTLEVLKGMGKAGVMVDRSFRAHTEYGTSRLSILAIHEETNTVVFSDGGTCQRE